MQFGVFVPKEISVGPEIRSLQHFCSPRGLVSLATVLGLVVLLALPQAAAAALPSGWFDADLGAPAVAGSATFTNGTWTISAGATDICTSDQMHFAWRGVDGDCVITAQVKSLTGTPNAQAGVLMRNDATTVGGLEASVLATATNGVTFQWRSAVGPGCSYQVVIGGQNLGAPIWVSLVRSGNAFSGYWSTNNVDWYQVGSVQTIALNPIAVAGLVVSANSASALCTAVFTDVAVPPPVFGVYRELWTGLNPAVGNNLSALTNAINNPNWPDKPDPAYTDVLSVFETQTNSGMTYYGQRLRTFVVPPMSGNYTFWIASHNTSSLSLSTDETSAHATPIAWVNTASNPREWTHEANQQSAPTALRAGNRYYLEALMQQSTGVDNCAVRWQLPNGTNEEPIRATSPAGTFLVSCRGVDLTPGIYLQPGNLTVSDGADAVFSLLVTNPGPVTYQWRANGTPLAGSSANNPWLVISNANPALHNNQTYTCVVTNAAGAVTSAPALLTVIADITAPTVLGSRYVNSTNLQLIFSEPLSLVTATNPSNYLISGGPVVTSASLNADKVTVALVTTPLASGSNYVITINNIQDRASAPNTIAANTQITVFAGPFTPLGVGGPTPAGSIASVGGGFNVGGGGRDIGGTSDQFQFAYQAQTGDFDVQIRVAGLSQTDPYAKAGLMAREDLSLGSRFAAILATPSLNGVLFESRGTAGGNTTTTGNLPVNFPQQWLRLKRAGNQFTGYGSYDGLVWQQLGTTSIALTNTIYFGMAVCSHSPSASAIAQFRDLAPVTNATTGLLSLPFEPLGPSSRKTPIVISEIMYKPAPRADTNNLEFIEIYNSNPWFQDISGYRIAGGSISYTFPPQTIVPGGGFLVIAASPASMVNVYGITNVVGPYVGTLKKDSTIELRDEQGAVLLTVPYSNVAPWPVAADGTGHSLVLTRPTYGEADPHAWEISDVVGGSPGQMEAFRASPLRNVCINEFLAHTDAPDYDYVELYNHSSQPVDISGCILTDDPHTNKFVVPPGTTIQPGSFVFYSETNMNFRLDAVGESIYLINPDQTRFLDAVHFDGQENGVATGRWPDGADEFYRLAGKTPGGTNAAIRQSDIIINELMYDPISGDDDDQYVELYNRSTNIVNLSGWQLIDAISFTFPSNTILRPDNYLVVARNAARLRTNYANLNAANCLGDFSGRLSHNGEHLALTMAGSTVQTNGLGIVSTNALHILVNEVTYASGGRWGQWSAGGGSSLELVNPNTNTRLAANWADSDETQKSSWVNIETTGVLDNGANYDPSIQYAQIGLLDVGECLVDNIEVRSGTSGVNLVLNSDFEAGLGNWTLQGDHFRSSIENSGYSSAHSLHIRCSDRMWTGVNSCQMALSANSLGSGQIATLRFKARWLHGWPEALLRLNGNWLEATSPLPVPVNLGTPGQRNSRYVANAGPAVYAVTHSPPLPAAGQSVVVTARVHDPAGIQNLTLNYRLDPSLSYTAVPMLDTGAGGDAIVGDGIYSATIPGQAANVISAFYIAATDTQSASTRFPALVNDNAPVRECVVRFGDANPGGSFGVYHLWITSTNTSRWISLSDLSNEAHDCTMVNGPRVIYNVQARWAGSPYHQNFNTPNGNACHYKWIFPDDDKFLGATSFNKIHQPGNGAGDDASIQREQTANMFLRALGVPWLNRRYVAVYVNGSRRGTLMEDAQTPDADVVKEHFPDDTEGWLYKMQPWFEFAPTPSGASIGFNNNSWCTLNNYTTSGGMRKTARYRYNFLVRRSVSSASDFTNVFSLVDAANTFGSPGYVANMQNMADMENWLRVFAANHAAGNWDAFGCPNGQNLYGYLGAKGTRYTLLMFDFNIVIGNGIAWGPGQNLFSGGSGPEGNIYNEPTFRRMYWRALQELINGPLNTAVSGPLIDAKYATFVANGLSVENPTNIKNWLTQARTSIASQLAAENTANFTLNPSVVVNNNVAYISGTAPVNVKTVWFNGVEWPITWNSVTGWTATVPLQPGNNPFTVLGVDIHGNMVAGASNTVSVVYNGTLPSPLGQIVINEIMFRPAFANADYVELFNNSSSATFDLSGWNFNGLSYDFPPGAMIAPRQHLVLAANRAAFAAAYGATTPVFDTYDGGLQLNGETLTLIKTATNLASQVEVAKVRYKPLLPWPANTNLPGPSLQLIDPTQDNWRAGNWAIVQTNATAAPQWQYVTLTGTAPRPILLICMHGAAGDVYVDDLKLVAGTVPESGPNLLQNGDFESPLSGPWTVSANMAGSVVSTAVKHSGTSSLHVVATSPGDTIGASIWENTAPIVTNGTYTLSYWYLPSTNGTQLLLRLSGSSPGSGQVYSLQNLQPSGPATTLYTPGGPNSTLATLPAFPPLWLNELQALNVTGITNSAGQHAPWLELYNPSANTVPLAGLYLSADYNNLAAWAFPPGAVMQPGEFKTVFADGRADLSTLTELHTSFTLSSGSGSLALSRPYSGSPRVLDFVDYTNLTPNASYGSVPDGQSFIRQEFFYPSPATANNGSTPSSFIPYAVAGFVYSQNFDSLPNPGEISVNAANPVTVNGIIYSLANPYDFAYPASVIANSGGLGISSLAGWYGLGSLGSKFGATFGDQTTGGQLSFGLPSSPNRALGLLATSSTGATAFGVKFINQTPDLLKYLNVDLTTELWRQSDLPKTLTCYYFVDPTGTAPFSRNYTAFLPALSVAFPTDPAASGGVEVDGTAAPNQVNLSVANELIAGWPPGAALWLVWEMSDPTGRAQGLAIDDFSFSASGNQMLVPVPITPFLSTTNIVLSWPAPAGQTYQLEFSDNLTSPVWLPLGGPVVGTGGSLVVTNTITSSVQRFYRLRVLP